MREQPSNLPLQGVRILSQAIVWAGPFATMLLADLGAELYPLPFPFEQYSDGGGVWASPPFPFCFLVLFFFRKLNFSIKLALLLLTSLNSD